MGLTDPQGTRGNEEIARGCFVAQVYLEETAQNFIKALDAKDSIIKDLQAALTQARNRKDGMCYKCRDPKATPVSPRTLCYHHLEAEVASQREIIKRLLNSLYDLWNVTEKCGLCLNHEAVEAASKLLDAIPKEHLE